MGSKPEKPAPEKVEGQHEPIPFDEALRRLVSTPPKPKSGKPKAKKQNKKSS